jgi:hypothetical protein
MSEHAQQIIVTVLVITWPSKHTLFQSKLWQSLQHEIIYQKATTNPNIDQEILEYHWHQWNVQQRLLWQYYDETVNGNGFIKITQVARWITRPIL